MKQYKHKNTGDIAIMSTNNSSFYICDGLNIHTRIIENSNDWQEIVEKDYEVLSFIADTGLIRFRATDNLFQAEGDVRRKNTTEEYLLLEKNWIIHSVKRLSDGEVFTVGDLCKVKNTTTKDNIISFAVNPKGLSAHSRNFTQYINNIEKVKQALFTTEDGVDIFKGDNITSVNLDSLKIYATTHINTGESLNYGNYKHFSTKEAAEEYILLNKPCLSINDIKAFDASTYHYIRVDRLKLKELVQSRTNN